eukprot:CAMPEP_0114996886 /NCGR_PEP_ID=MMETSP0216-20121206/14580_1 /TAXON_ID=223996 /ORGANISM="Protocruzia adherens, Strain Boccale" /LENGTH=267 /DNA_ID=CAMNT_0002361181 /DNA_START=39 /DNA_END=842 /DNA_ORIENTATION=-
MDKRPIGYDSKKGYALDKKVPKNPKYQNVKSTLNTGKTVNKVDIVSDKLISKKKNEMFKRVKPSTVAKLLTQAKPADSESIYKLGEESKMDDPIEEHFSANMSDKLETESVSSLLSHQTQESTISAITYATEQLGINDETSFLLLDLRDSDDYDLYHIKESLNFPAPNISRDRIIPELFRFKNKEDKLIIVYTMDERSGTQAAQLFSQKGYDNIYLISGGIEDFLEQFPELIEGIKIPSPKKDSKKVKSIKAVKKGKTTSSNIGQYV